MSTINSCFAEISTVIKALHLKDYSGKEKSKVVKYNKEGLLGTKFGQTQSRARQKIVKCKEADGVGVMILSGGVCIQYVKKKQRNKCF